MFLLFIKVWGWGESNSLHHGLQPCALPMSYSPINNEGHISFLSLLMINKEWGVGHVLSNVVIEPFVLTSD